MTTPEVSGPMLHRYRVHYQRNGCATLELVVYAVDAQQARGACAFPEAAGWKWIRTEDTSDAKKMVG